MKDNFKDFKVLAPFHVKSVEVVDETNDDIIKIEGWANWSGKDEYGQTYSDLVGDVVVPSGVDTAVWETNPQILLQHDRDETIGRGLRMEKNSDGLYLEAEIHRKAMADKDFYRVQSGLLSMFSIGFRPIDGEWKELDSKECFFITKSLLFEVSVVSIPCNSRSNFSVVKSVGDGSFCADIKDSKVDDIDDHNSGQLPDDKEKELPMKVTIKYADYLSEEEQTALKEKGVDVQSETEIDLVELIKRVSSPLVSEAIAEEKRIADEKKKEEEEAEEARKQADEEKRKEEEEAETASMIEEIQKTIDELKTTLSGEEEEEGSDDDQE